MTSHERLPEQEMSLSDTIDAMMTCPECPSQQFVRCAHQDENGKICGYVLGCADHSNKCANHPWDHFCLGHMDRTETFCTDCVASGDAQ